MVSNDNFTIALTKDKAKSHDFFLIDIKVLWNDKMDHLLFIKYFELWLHPIILRLDGFYLEWLYWFYLESIKPNLKSFLKPKAQKEEIVKMNSKKNVPKWQIFLEYFYVSDISINLAFKSSSWLFSQTSINSTFKIVLSILASCKEIQLNFKKMKFWNE